MNIDDIKEELKRRGWTYIDLAEKLAMGKSSIYNIMNGVSPLKESLRRHIELIFNEAESAVLVYKINLTERQVYDLTAGQQFPPTEEGQKRRAEAVEAVIKHNMEQLEKMGRTVFISRELRQIIKVLDENLPKIEGNK